MDAKEFLICMGFVADMANILNDEAERYTHKTDALSRLIDLMEEYPSLPCAEVLEAFFEEEEAYDV